MLQLFKSFYPNLADKIKSCKKVLGDREIEVALTDGRAYIFDAYNETLRQLPSNSKYITKKECEIEFGYRLRKLMSIKGITQTELSHRADVRQGDLSAYMNGKRAPTFYVVDRIAKALDVSIDEFRYI